jgi:hypothetical protein
MKPIDRKEVLSIGEYERIRDHFRGRVIERKRARRVAVGEHMSVVFENRDTVLLQIQEMLRTERITSESGILHEIATYNELVPADDELSMTLFVEVADAALRDALLRRLAGLERHVSLQIDGARFSASPLGRAGAEDPGRTTAVHYFKIPLGPAHAARLRGGGSSAGAVVVDHPSYAAFAPLGPEAMAELAADLAWGAP